MNKLYSFASPLLSLLVSLPALLLAQGNYVVNTSNNSTTATYGTYNTLVGPFAGASGNLTGNSNSFVGYLAGERNTTGSSNSFVGTYAGINNTTGSSNSFVGGFTGVSNTTGSYNSFVGTSAGYTNTTGASNTFIGYQAGYANTTGTNNTFIGNQAAQNATTGSNNIIIGPASGTAVTTGNDNVLMGYNAQAEDGLHNATAIGSGSRVATNNALILGHQVNVGIGTTAPNSKLEVVADEANTSGLRLTHLTSQSKPTHATDQFLTVNEKGDVIKARYQLRISNASEWSDNVFALGHQLRPLASVAAYIGQHGHLPGVPSAAQVVQEGVDLVKMNATLLEKVEELTLYSIQLEKTNQNQQRINQEQQLKLQTLDQKHQQELQQVKAEMGELKLLVKQLIEKK